MLLPKFQGHWPPRYQLDVILLITLWYYKFGLTDRKTSFGKWKVLPPQIKVDQIYRKVMNHPFFFHACWELYVYFDKATRLPSIGCYCAARGLCGVMLQMPFVETGMAFNRFYTQWSLWHKLVVHAECSVMLSTWSYSTLLILLFGCSDNVRWTKLTNRKGGLHTL